MTPLRRQMIEAMQQRGFSPRTHESYLSAVADLAGYYRLPPDRLSFEQVKGWVTHLAVERSLSGSSCRLYLNGARFLYREVLHRPGYDEPIAVPKRAQRIPELLTRTEVARILACCANGKHRMMLALCYGCGLRVSELMAVKVRHIDGERRQLRVEQGKGAKDRLVPIGEQLLGQLRAYWRRYRPAEWLFPSGSHPDRPLEVSTAQKAFGHAKAAAGIDKVGGIHALRHAFATHQLEAGLPVHRLQRLLGHQDIRTTLRYVHWVPDYHEGQGAQDLIGALEVSHG
jgi:integrase/recombinase XerD